MINIYIVYSSIFSNNKLQKAKPWKRMSNLCLICRMLLLNTFSICRLGDAKYFEQGY